MKIRFNVHISTVNIKYKYKYVDFPGMVLFDLHPTTKYLFSHCKSKDSKYKY